jgi:mRNA-degrading endonuclease RelE of RelBE toxin-antitoxin system
MIIIETPLFTKQLLSNLSDEEYRLFQATLLERPDAGKVIPGGGGLRKVRWGLEGRGKSGGARVIYYWFTERGVTGNLIEPFSWPFEIVSSSAISFSS